MRISIAPLYMNKMASKRIADGLRWQVQQLGAQQWWSKWRVTFDDVFFDFIDGLIRKGEAAG